MGATVEGYRRVLGFVEASIQDPVSVCNLLEDLVHRGLSVEQGLLCVTPGITNLSRSLTERYGEQIRFQHCQMHKRARVVSYLPVSEQREIQGAITRAYGSPDLASVRTALEQVHTQLQSRNRSAAQWLMRNLELSLTLHQSGLYDQLSRSLRSTQCVLLRTVQQLNRRLRGVRQWLAPPVRRAQFALLLLEIEARMRRLAHAAYLSPMRTALFSKDQTPK